jgi:hypothetical protein
VAWPDQVKDRVTAATVAPDSGVWKLDLAARCKGTSTVTVTTSQAPLKDAAALAAWQTEQVTTLAKAQPSFKKPREQKALDL